MARPTAMWILVVVYCLIPMSEAADLKQDPVGGVVPGVEVTFCCLVIQTTSLTWRIEIDSSMTVSHSFLSMDNLDTPMPVGNFSAILTNVDFDPVDSQIANFTSTLKVTAFLSLNNARVLCLGALPTQEANTTLIVLGIPGKPDVPTVTFINNKIVLELRTSVPAGVSPHSFGFEVQVYQLNANTDFVIRMNFPNYVSGEQVLLTVDNLIIGEEYQFAVQAYNQFGVSELSNRSNIVTIPDLSEEDVRSGSKLSEAEWVGVGLGILATLALAVVVVLILVIVKIKKQGSLR